MEKLKNVIRKIGDKEVYKNSCMMTTDYVAKYINPVKHVEKPYLNIPNVINSTQFMSQYIGQLNFMGMYITIPGETWAQISEAIPHVPIEYYISTYGRIFNILTQRIYCDNNTEYSTFAFTDIYGNKTKLLSYRTVLMVFMPIPNMNLYQVNHKDSCPYHNWIWNLEWCTPRQNTQHMARVGGGGGKHLHQEWQIRRVCEGLVKKMSYEDIMDYAEMEHNDSEFSTIVQIKMGKIWPDISAQYPIPKEYSYQFMVTDDQVRQICQFINDGVYDYRYVLKQVGIDVEPMDAGTRFRYRKLFTGIKNGHRFFSISRYYDFSKNFTNPSVKKKLEDRNKRDPMKPLLT